MDALTALRLQAEWGADEALGEAPVNRFRLTETRAAPGSAQRPAPSRPAAPAPRTAQPARIAAPLSATSLDELHAALQGFEECALRATATHTVLPDGNPASPLVVIGDAPGADDDRSGRAFSGPPGQALDRVLRSIGLDRSAMLLTTLVPWRPPGNRPLSEAEIQACLPFLLRLLELVQPQRLLLLGTAPVRILTGSTEPIRRLRGRWLTAAVPGLPAPVPALPMPPLDQWLRSPASKRDTWSDLLTLKSVTTTG